MFLLIQRLYYTFILLSIFPFLSWGQTIKGTLLTEESMPINFSLVSLYELTNEDSKVIHQMFPSNEGSFIFDNIHNGSYLVVIEGGLGFDTYQSDTLTIQKTQIDLGTITLSYATQETGEVVVTADRVKPLLEMSIDKTTINVEGTSLNTLPSTLDILQISPNVSIKGEKVTVSGKSNVLVLLNGKRTSLKLENIPASIIESIDIISNPSVKYDANVEAVINVIVKKGSMEGIQGSIYTRYTQGVYPRVNVGANILANKGKFTTNFNIDYNYRHTKEITDANRKFEITPPYYYSSTLLEQENKEHNFFTNLDLGWDFSPKQSITLSGEYTLLRAPNNTINQTDQFRATFEGETLDSALINKATAKSVADNYNVQLSYNGQFGDYWNLSSAINYMTLSPFNNSGFAFNFTNKADPSNDHTINYQMNDSTKARLLIGQADASWEKENNLILFGLKYTDINTYYSIVFNNNNTNFTGQNSWFKYNESIYALYFQWKGGYKKFQWRLGMRGEYAWTKGIDQSATNTNLGRFNYFPLATILFSLSDDHVFRLAYNKSIQRVHFFDRSPYQYYTSLYTKFVGNPALRPQITHSIQFDYSLMQQFLITLYYNEQVDYMNQILERTGTLETFKNINFQNSNFGISIGSEFALADWWKVIFNISGVGIYTRGVTQNQPFNTLSIFADLYLMQRFNLWNWMSMDAIATYHSPYALAIYKSSHLFSFDLSFRKKFLKDKLTVSLYISDVFGTNIEYNSIDFNTQQMTAVQNRDVRTIGLSIMYNISKGRQKEIDAINTIDDNTLDRIKK